MEGAWALWGLVDVVHWGTREDLQIRWKDSVCGKCKAFSECMSSHRAAQLFLALIQHLCPWDWVMEPDSPLLREMCVTGGCSDMGAQRRGTGSGQGRGKFHPHRMSGRLARSRGPVLQV